MAKAKRKPARRRKSVNFQVRMHPDLVARFDQMIDVDMKGEVNADGDALNRTDLVGYFARWLTGLPPEKRVEWARVFRDDHMEQIKRGGVEKSEPEKPSGGEAPVFRGHDTVGAAVPVEDVFKPGKTRPGGRTERKKMDTHS